MEKVRITLSSLPDRENLVAEIFFDGVQFAEISNENNQFLIQFYPHPRKDCWELPFNKVLEVIKNAKLKLLG